MLTIGINDSNDIFLDAQGNLAVKQDIEAMGDILINKSQTNRGELQYDDEKGIDFFNTIFGEPAYPDLFQNELLNELENTQAVQAVSDFTPGIKDGVYSYRVNVKTDYGQIALQG